jgi:IclR family transcriptional regulator, KDG regulon repressor
MAAKTNQSKPYYQVSTLLRGLGVMELLANEGDLTVSQTANKLGINRASAHRFLNTLRDGGYVLQADSGSYRLSFKVFELGQKVIGGLAIVELGRPFLKKLADTFNETVNLGQWESGEILLIDQIRSTEVLLMGQPIGGREPAHCTAMGKAILAMLPPEKLEKYLETAILQKITGKTITSKKALRQELDQIRQRGFAIDDEETSWGLRCVAAPVFDHMGFPSYALGVSGPTTRVTSEAIDRIQKVVLREADGLSRAIGRDSP